MTGPGRETPGSFEKETIKLKEDPKEEDSGGEIIVTGYGIGQTKNRQLPRKILPIRDDDVFLSKRHKPKKTR